MRPVRPVAGGDAHAASRNPASVGYVRPLKAVPRDGASASLPERVEEVQEVEDVDDGVAVHIGIA